MVAEELNLPQVTTVNEFIAIDKKNKTIDVSRLDETNNEIIRSNYPIVLTVDESINTPRYMSARIIKDIMNQEITVWNENDLDCDINRIGMKGSPTIVTDTYVPEEAARSVVMLKGNAQEAAKSLIKILEEKHLL